MHTKLAEIAQLINDYRTLLLKSVNPLSQSQLDWRANEDEWSIGEVLDHLFLVETRSSKVISKYATELKDKNISAPPLDGSALASLDQFQIETVLTKRKAPEFLVPRTGIAKAELLAQLEECRVRLLEIIGALDAYDLHQFHFPHPVLGKIDLYQWIIFIGKHERRHLTQVETILARTEFPATEATVARL